MINLLRKGLVIIDNVKINCMCVCVMRKRERSTILLWPCCNSVAVSQRNTEKKNIDGNFRKRNGIKSCS